MRYLGDKEKRSNAHKIEISKLEVIEKRVKAICERVIAENSSKIIKNIVLVWITEKCIYCWDYNLCYYRKKLCETVTSVLIIWPEVARSQTGQQLGKKTEHDI